MSPIDAAMSAAILIVVAGRCGYWLVWQSVEEWRYRHDRPSARLLALMAEREERWPDDDRVEVRP